MKRHVIALLVEDKPGVMLRIVGMFTRRGFNIDTITVGKTEKIGTSRITLTMEDDEETLEQVIKQLRKLIDVIRVVNLDEKKTVVAELCFAKVHTKTKKSVSEVTKYSDLYKGKIVDVAPDSLTIRVVGTPEKVDSFLELMNPYGVKEIVRTGVTAIAREPKS